MKHRPNCCCDECCDRSNKAHVVYTREYRKWINRTDKKESAHELAMKKYREAMK